MAQQAEATDRTLPGDAAPVAYAFTGPTDASPGIIGPLRKLLLAMPPPNTVVTGAAFGVDTLAARLALELWPDAHHVVVVPQGWHNAGLVKELAAAGVEVVRMPVGTGYLDRNRTMVSRATRLIALPATEREILRSGTWATVRAARKAHVPVCLTSIECLLS